ncbi:MAG: SMC-Scp complex subunit ScpB [Acutalibacteraceae bacterium]|nr:SMC-Scp complex subunit ScpB [Acutalibacteraceae bacterium]
MNKDEIFGAVEAILFASGTPVEIEKITVALELDTATVNSSIDELIKIYSSNEKGIKIIRLNKSVQMVTNKQYGPYVRKVMDMKKNTPLSQAAMEVLAVVAYNQPVTKAFVEQVRGVDCSGVIGSLCQKGLIEEKGRLELPGRPLLYGTTDHFLRCFSIETLDGLPKLPEKKEDNENDEQTE